MTRNLAKFFVVLTGTIVCQASAAFDVHLNHYSDYGTVEQAQKNNQGSIQIKVDSFGYSDEYTDSESGLQYLQVRYYDPAIMRFTQMDTYPLLNRYAYANDNPVMDDDPSGHNAIGASSSKLENDTADVGTPESVLGVVLALGFLATGFVGNEVGFGAALINVTSVISGGFSYIFPDSKTREIMSLYSLGVSTAVNIMDMGAAFYNYKQPARFFDVADGLSSTGHSFIGDNSSYYQALLDGCGEANCGSTNMSLQEHLVNSVGRGGGYEPIKSDTPNYAKLNRLIFSNKTVPVGVTTSEDFLEAVSAKLGDTPGVYGIWLRQGRVAHLGTVIIDNASTAEGVYLIDPKQGKINTLQDLLGRAEGMSPTNRVWVSFYRVGDFNQSTLTNFLAVR